MNTQQMNDALSKAYLSGNKKELQRLNVALLSMPRKERTLDEIFAEAKAKKQRRGGK
jgi:hypothetical protein